MICECYANLNVCNAHYPMKHLYRARQHIRLSVTNSMTYCNTVWWEGLGKINATLAASAYKGWLAQFNALPGFTLVKC